MKLISQNKISILFYIYKRVNVNFILLNGNIHIFSYNNKSIIQIIFYVFYSKFYSLL